MWRKHRPQKGMWIEWRFQNNILKILWRTKKLVRRRAWKSILERHHIHHLTCSNSRGGRRAGIFTRCNQREVFSFELHALKETAYISNQFMVAARLEFPLIPSSWIGWCAPLLTRNGHTEQKFLPSKLEDIEKKPPLFSVRTNCEKLWICDQIRWVWETSVGSIQTQVTDAQMY